MKTVRSVSGRNPVGVEAEIRELEKEIRIPKKEETDEIDEDENDFW